MGYSPVCRHFVRQKGLSHSSHSTLREPGWDENVLFHVRKYETTSNLQLTIQDWGKPSSNDYIGDVTFDMKRVLKNAQNPES